MIRKWHVALLVLPLMLAAACGSDDPDSPPPSAAGTDIGSAAPAPEAPAANPVDILRQAGGTPTGGSTVGVDGGDGTRTADGTIGPEVRGANELITVTTWTPAAALPEKPSDDDTWYVRGDGFQVELTGMLNTVANQVEFPAGPEDVAAKTGGKVVPRG